MKTLPADKANHVAAGAWVAGASVLATTAGAWVLGALPITPALAAAAGCAVAAVAREVYNKARGGVFDLADVAATLAGGAPVVVALMVA